MTLMSGRKVSVGAGLGFAIVLLATFQGVGVEMPVSSAESHWKMSLRDLGHSHVSLPTEEAVNRSDPILIPLPEDAQQGPIDWWLLHTHFMIEFDPASGPGIVWVSAGTNNRIAVQLKITVRDPGRGFLASRVELLNGPSRIFTLDPTQTYSIANYLQNRGVKPGHNELRFQLRKTEDVRVKRLVFLDDSSLIRIPVGTPKLDIDATFPEEEVVLGREFRFDLHLSSSRWPVKSLSFDVTDPNDAFRIETSSKRSIESLNGSQTWPYWLTPVKTGSNSLIFSASTRNAGNPRATFETTVYAPGQEPSRQWLIPWLWGIVVGTFVAGGILVLWNVRAYGRRNLLLLGGARSVYRRSRSTQAVVAVIVLALTTGYSLGLSALSVSRFALSVSDVLGLLLGGVLLVISFTVGAVFQSSKAGAIPILGYLMGLFLWYAALPWQEFGSITGDLGWAGYVLVPGVPSLFMYLSFLFGKAFNPRT